MTLDDPGQFHLVLGFSRGISPIPAALLKVAYPTILPMSELGAWRTQPLAAGFRGRAGTLTHWDHAVAMVAMMGRGICGR